MNTDWLTPQFALFLVVTNTAFVIVAVSLELTAIGEFWAFVVGVLFSTAVEPLRDKLQGIERQERGETA